MWIFPLQVQLATVIEEIKRELQMTDKALAIDLGYDSAAEYAKGKHGVRAMGTDRWLSAPPKVFDAFLRIARRLHAADLPAAPPAQYPDADLLDDIAAQLQAFRRRMVKADLHLVSDERKRA